MLCAPFLRPVSVHHQLLRFITGNARSLARWIPFSLVIVGAAPPVAAQELMPASTTGWTAFAARPDTTPGVVASGSGSAIALEIHGNGVPNVYGGWRTRIAGLQGNSHYRLRARALPVSIGYAREAITILMRWRGAFGAEVAPDYVWNYQQQADGTLTFDRILKTPAGTTAVDVELVLQWAPKGSVRFDGLSLVPSPAPVPRPVKVAAVSYRPSGTSSGLESVQRAAQYGDQVAAAHRPDVMVFGELLNVIGAPGTYDMKAEAVPGPSTDAMASLARSYGTHVVFGLLERSGSFVYNTAVWLDRNGNVAGKYRKVQLPLSEAAEGISPGESVPVFNTDFGRVALLICQDMFFPEPAREAAIKGAEMILLPIWGGKQAVVRARAINHSMYVVASGYDYASEVIDPLGQVLDVVPALNQPDVALATIDLSQRFREDWSGDWRDTSNKQRRTAPYTADPGADPGGDPPPPPPDTTPPAVSVTSPAAGATVSGIITVVASATDNVGVTGVRFAVDGVTIGAEDTSAPYSASWDTRTVANGVHTITATARDAAGHTSVSSVNVTVANQSTPPGSTPFSGTPVALPGRVEVENFDNGGINVAYYDTTAGNRTGAYRQTDVDLEASLDGGGGYNLAKVRAGEWLHYSVNVATAGSYTLRVRVASAGAGGRFHIESGGVDRSGPLTIPDTGGWQTWTTITAAMTLPAGPQTLRLVIDAETATGVVGNVNWFEVAATGGGSTPFTGTPVPVPGRIQAEAFDNGGANVAYADTTTGNAGGAYRQTDVDLEPTSDTGGGHSVGWVRAGEWLKYSVNVPTAGTYVLRLRVAAETTGGRVHVESQGIDITGAMNIPGTGSWQTWTTISATVTLGAGPQVLRLVADSETNGVVGNINWLELVRQ